MKLDIVYARVGTTRSGKIIPYTSSANSIADIMLYFRSSDCSSDDLLDAFAVFNYLAVRGIRRGDESEIYEHYANQIGALISPTKLREAKNRANVLSAFDFRDLGKSLTSVEFADF